jgi:hypothetical protein
MCSPSCINTLPRRICEIHLSVQDYCQVSPVMEGYIHASASHGMSDHDASCRASRPHLPDPFSLRCKLRMLSFLIRDLSERRFRNGAVAPISRVLSCARIESMYMRSDGCMERSGLLGALGRADCSYPLSSGYGGRPSLRGSSSSILDLTSAASRCASDCG